MTSKKLSGIIRILKPNKLTIVYFVVLFLFVGFLIPIYPTHTIKDTTIVNVPGETYVTIENKTTFHTIWEVYHYDFEWTETYVEPLPLMGPPEYSQTFITWEHSAEPAHQFIVIPAFILIVYLLSIGLVKFTINLQDEKIREQIEKR